MKRRRANQRLIEPVRPFRAAAVLAAFLMITTAVAGTSIYKDYYSHAAGGWLSGVSGEGALDGSFGSWRGEPVTIVGSWSDTAECAPDACTVGDFDGYGGAMDFAMGGIYRDNGESWSAAAGGAYDSRFQNAINIIKQHRAGKGTTYVRFAHEFNLGYSDWAVTSGDVNSYITTFRRVADMLHAAGLKVTWSPNDGEQEGGVVAPQAWPGDQYVDVVGVDSYDWDTDPNAGSLADPEGIEMWRQFAQAHGKPLALPEWGANNSSGAAKDNPQFITDRWNFMSSHAGSGAGQFIYDVYFNFTGGGSNYGIGLYPDTRVPNMASTYMNLNWGNGGLSGGGGTTTPTPTQTPGGGGGGGSGTVSQTGNLLAGKAFSSTVAISTSEPGHPLSYVNDGNDSTRWISQPTSPVSLTADMGASYTLNKVSIKWAADTINHFQIQVSPDNTNWTTVVSGTTNNTTAQYADYTSFRATPTGRYFRVVGADRWNSSYGNSIWEIGAYGATSAGDTTPPSVQLTSPAAGASVKGTTPVTGTASDNQAVTRVDLLVDGAIRGTNTSSSANFNWDSTSVGDGNHSLALRAYDAAGNPATTPAITVNVNNAGPTSAPNIQAFSAVPATIVAGGRTTLYWSTTGVSACSINPGGPQLTTSTSWQTPNLTTTGSATTGTATYTLDCMNSSGAHTSKNTTVTVTGSTAPPGKPTFVASNSLVTSGSTVTLSWYSAGATSCKLAPNNITSSGSSGSFVTGKITASSTFNLTCSNTAGSASANPLTVSVGSGASVQPSTAQIVSFFADPARIPAGQTSTLYWSTTGIPSGGCNLNPSPLNTTGPNGNWTTPYLLGSKSYTLTCVGSNGTVVSQSASVIVNDISAPASPASVTPAVNTSNSTQTNLTASNGQAVVNGSVATTVSGLVTLDPSNITSSSKEKSITKVEYYEGQALIQTDSIAPFVLDTTKLSNGSHTITERTYYTDGSRSEITRVLSVDNSKKVATTANNTGAIIGIVLTFVVLLGVGGGILFLVMRNRVTVSSLRSRYGNSIDTTLIDPGK